MLRFDGCGIPTHLIINWEQAAMRHGDALELVIASVELPFQVSDSGIAKWADEDKVAAVVVESSAFRKALIALNGGERTLVTLPPVLGCESRLVIESTEQEGVVKFLIEEVHGTSMGLMTYVRLPELVGKLYLR